MNEPELTTPNPGVASTVSVGEKPELSPSRFEEVNKEAVSNSALI
jgi:hypothetical protein